MGIRPELMKCVLQASGEGLPTAPPGMAWALRNSMDHWILEIASPRPPNQVSGDADGSVHATGFRCAGGSDDAPTCTPPAPDNGQAVDVEVLNWSGMPLPHGLPDAPNADRTVVPRGTASEALSRLYSSARLPSTGPGSVFVLLDHLISQLERMGDDRAALGAQAPPVTGSAMRSLAWDFRLAVQAAELAWREARVSAPSSAGSALQTPD